MPETLGVRAFAKLIDVHPTTVSAACKPGGRLAAAVVQRTATGHVQAIDPIVGLLEWRKNTDVTKAPPAHQARAAERMARIGGLTGVPPAAEVPSADVMEGAAAGKHWDAKLKEAKYRSLVRELVPARAVEAQLRDVFTQCKVRLLAIPSRAKQELPHLSVDDVAKIDALIREACEDLAYSASGAPTEPVEDEDPVLEDDVRPSTEGDEEPSDPLGSGYLSPDAEGEFVGDEE